MNNMEVWFVKVCILNIIFFSLSFSQIDSIGIVPDRQNTPNNLYKLSLGIGVGTMDLGLVSSFAYDFNGQVLSIHAVSTNEFKIFGDNPVEYIGDIGLLYGISVRWYSWYASAGAGISYVHSMNRGRLLSRSYNMFGPDEYEKIFRSTVGLPIQIEILGPSFPSFGFAIVGFANINSIKSYGGITFCIQVGKLR